MGREIVNYNEAYAKAAEEAKKAEPLSQGQFITVKGGILKFGDMEMPGNQMAVVIVDSVWENTYYDDRYDDDNPMPPICYAFARGEDKDEMAPMVEEMEKHPHFKAQSDDCPSCPLNEWGSADRGQGKACQNRRRLALIPAGIYEKERGSRDFRLDLFEDEEHYENAEMAFMKVSVTSVKAYAAYVTQIASQLQRPPFGVVTRISVVPDSRTQHKLHFELVEEMPDYLTPIIFKRNEQARASIITPYAPPREDDRDRGRRGGRGGRGRDDRSARGRDRDDDRGRGRSDRDDDRGGDRGRDRDGRR